MSSVTVFNNSALAVSTKTSTTGAVRETFVSKKAFGITSGLKGKALARAHDEYKVRFGVAGNANVSVNIATGQWIAQSVTHAKDGLSHSVKFVNASELEAAQPTDAELIAMFAARGLKIPTVVPAVEVEAAAA